MLVLVVVSNLLSNSKMNGGRAMKTMRT